MYVREIKFNDVIILIVILTRQLERNLLLAFITKHNSALKIPNPPTSPILLNARKYATIFFMAHYVMLLVQPFFIVTSDTPQHRSQTVLTGAQ